MSPMRRSFELERVARQLQGVHLPDRDPEQSRESVRFDPDVFAFRDGDAQRPSSVPERVALQDHAVALGHLEMRVRGAQILEGLPLGHQTVDPRHVDSLQRRAVRERT